MSGEPQTTRELYDDIIARRGGAERFSPEQLRLVHALVIALAKPAEIDPSAVSRLMDLLPPPKPEPEPAATQRDDRDAAVAPLLKLYRHLHESVHTLSAENAQLKAALRAGAVPVRPDVPMADVVLPGEIGDCYAGARRGPDDPRPPVTIEGRAVPASAVPQAKPVPPQNWDDTPNGRAWNAWRDAGGDRGFDRWSNRNF